MSRLTLAARIAAFRFASTRRREARRAPHAWLPIALRWRQQRKRLEKGRLGRAAAPAAAWLAHVHLHLNLRIGDWTSTRRRLEGNRLSHAATFASPTAAAPLAHVHRHFHARLSELRRRDEVRSIAREAQQIETALSHHSTTVRSRTFPVRSRGLDRPLHLFHATSAATPKIAAFAAAVGRSPRTPRPSSIATRTFVDRWQRLIFEAKRKNVRVSTSATHARTHSVERLARIRTRELRTFHLLASVVGHAARRHAMEGQTSQRVPPGRPPELVWRSATRPAVEIAAETGHADSRSMAAHPMAPEGPARSGPAALQMRDLDPALLDRWTDDVIRRVERRARIERERRGL
ncbi:MAG: hypothetical protein ACXW5U_10575 [Thermoanaerobaculia bacterium]